VNANTWVVVDLGFGDAGKGSITDFLVRDRGAELVVRYNGGAQAGHNVVTDDGRHHTFAQFGAGTFAGAATLLGPAVLLHPLAMAVEAEHLESLGIQPWKHTFIDARCRVISPFQQEAGRARERARCDFAHGSCGVGVGECVYDDLRFPDETLRAANLLDPGRVRWLLSRQRDRKHEEIQALGVEPPPWFHDPGFVNRVADAWLAVARRWNLLDPDAVAARIAAARGIVFEGAQGALLDEIWGFHPHTTWSDTTCANALALAGDRPLTRLGVLRAYATRHGAGPFPTGGTLAVPEPHNRDDTPQGAFRTGVLDTVLLRYAVDVCPVDAIAVTCVDRVPEPRVCTRYAESGPIDLVCAGRLLPGAPADLDHRERLGAWLRTVTPVVEPRDPVEAVAAIAPVALISSGPTAGGKHWCGSIFAGPSARAR
jgi:adenylosuccinate synthase